VIRNCQMWQSVVQCRHSHRRTKTTRCQRTSRNFCIVSITLCTRGATGYSDSLYSKLRHGQWRSANSHAPWENVSCK